MEKIIISQLSCWDALENVQIQNIKDPLKDIN